MTLGRGISTSGLEKEHRSSGNVPVPILVDWRMIQMLIQITALNRLIKSSCWPLSALHHAPHRFGQSGPPPGSSLRGAPRLMAAKVGGRLPRLIGLEHVPFLFAPCDMPPLLPFLSMVTLSLQSITPLGLLLIPLVLLQLLSCMGMSQSHSI